ncbi:hypothetical protein IWQ62_001207 [Dispira parvispora]|uniref:Thioredoxin domain-containing protein n=1 Tax=Dispira parvispora TaxID=1520584 RepID=A0A9W8AU52_9FUNG|nr:hypothetical protein IWQ62_001207 [Dispira parvispora]
MYNAKSKVIELTKSNFKTEVMNTRYPVLVEFYAPWCGHCQRLAPEYDKVAKDLYGVVKVGAVNCDESANQALCAGYDVKGYPTVKLFPSKKNSKTKKKVPTDYVGERKRQPMREYALTYVPNMVVAVKAGTKASGDKSVIPKSATLEDFIAHEAHTAKVLLFTDKLAVTPLYKGLGIKLHRRMLLGWVPKGEKSIQEQFNIKSFPSLLVFPKGLVDDYQVYDGPVTFDALVEYLKPFALDQAASEKKQEPKHEEL